MAAWPGRSREAAEHTANLALGTMPWDLLCSHEMLNHFVSDKKTSSKTQVLVGSYAYILKTPTGV